MKKLALSLIGALSMLLTGGSAYAQAIHIRATVPFQFSIHNKTLPAGEYEVVCKGRNPGLLEIRDSEGPLLYVQTMDLQASNLPGETKLVFRQYGNTYFLSELWTEGSREGLEIPESSSTIREAKNNTGQQVMLAARLGK